MERDLALIREILLRVEQVTDAQGKPDLDIAGYTEQATHYNLDLSLKAGLVEGTGKWLQGRQNYIWAVHGLTWEGHDFLDSVRDKSVWQKAQRRAENAGLQAAQLTVDILKELGKAVIKESLGLGTGS